MSVTREASPVEHPDHGGLDHSRRAVHILHGLLGKPLESDGSVGYRWDESSRARLYDGVKAKHSVDDHPLVAQQQPRSQRLLPSHRRSTAALLVAEDEVLVNSAQQVDDPHSLGIIALLEGGQQQLRASLHLPGVEGQHHQIWLKIRQVSQIQAVEGVVAASPRRLIAWRLVGQVGGAAGVS